MNIQEAHILILASDGVEQSELMVPRDELRKAGATVVVASPKGGEIRGWKDKDWGDKIPTDRKISEIDAGDYTALVLPGGQINPDVLRADEGAMSLVRRFVADGKVVAAICHGPWLLVEAGAVNDRSVTSYKSIRTDLENAGGKWVDKEVVTDEGIITSRSPEDLPAFVSKIIEEVREGRHERKAA